MSRKNNNPDLTMLALAAYDAIRRNMEENDGEEKKAAEVHAAEQLLSLAIGIMIGLLAGLAHANSVQQHRQAIVSLPSEPRP